MPQIPTLVDMLKAGMHFGHQKSKWHPKMREYIYTARQDIHIVDLEKTAKHLDRVLSIIREVVAAGGQVMLVSLKTQADSLIKESALSVQMPYVIGRWLGGVFTNFSVISKLIRRLEKLETDKTAGEWSRYTKKEQLEMQKDLERLYLTVGGVRTMSKLPQLVFLVGVREGKNAVKECVKAGVPVAAMVDTDTNPTLITHVIPGNDDALHSIEMIVKLVVEAIQEGQKLAAENVAVRAAAAAKEAPKVKAAPAGSAESSHANIA